MTWCFPSRLAYSLCVLSFGFAGCGTPSLQPPAPRPDDLLRLEAARIRRPSDWKPGALLAGAYVSMGRPQDALVVIAGARLGSPVAPELHFLEGLAAEAAGDDESAIAAYRAYVEAGQVVAHRPEARGRLDHLELRAIGGRMVARVEEEGARPDSDTMLVVVMPFGWDTGDERLPPLAVAMEEVLSADLRATKVIRVADREEVRALVAALQPEVGEVGRVSIAERVGRILGAGVVVQGSTQVFDDRYVRLDATMLFLGPSTTSVAPATFEGTLDNIGLLQRRLTVLLYESMNLSWDREVSRRMDRGWSQFSVAWRWLGLGLTHWDVGDPEAAADAFDQALRHDQGFGLAQEWATRARYFAEAARPPEEVAWSSARSGVQRALSFALLTGGDTPGGGLRNAVGERDRGVLAEILGQDRIGGGSLVELIISGSGGTR